jgi:hypothetical protein
MLFITNYLLEEFIKKDLTTNIKSLYFNPWGFSKLGIENQIEEALKNKIDNVNVEIYFVVKNLFFGRRKNIALEKIKALYPQNKIHVLTEEELILFFDNTSI